MTAAVVNIRRLADPQAPTAPVGPVGLVNPLDRTGRIRGVLFDVDGTLYRQSLLRACMALELLTMPIVSRGRARRHWRAIRAYRQAQESLRASGGSGTPGDRQIAAAAARSGMSESDVRQLVDTWMQTRPLKYLRWCRMDGIVELLDLIDAAGVRAGVLSDYAAEAKLAALGLEGRFSPVLSASDPAIGALKPNPRGFLHACRVWGLRPAEVLMVGDRADADAAGAAAAGMPCVLIGRARGRASNSSSSLVLPSFKRLRHVLDDRR